MHIFIMNKTSNKIVFTPEKNIYPLLPRLSKCNSTFKDNFVSGKQINILQEPSYLQRNAY